ncbi:MAG: thioredoxin [Pseudomonadota bacterium]
MEYATADSLTSHRVTTYKNRRIRMSHASPQSVTSNTFDQSVLASQQPVLVDFWAEWCGPCRVIAPVLDQLAEDYDGRAAIRKVDVDANQDLAARYGIRSIPTLMVFKDGEPVETLTGVQSRSVLDAALERHA